MDLFANPTVARTAKLLRGEDARKAVRARRSGREDIAVIGMSGRFPGAPNVDELWANLAAGKERIRFFSDEELAAAGVPANLRARPDYVPAHGYLEGTKLFDAAFFGYTPKEAEVIDPQQRLFLEEAWHALENAGYDPGRYAGDIAVFAGTGMSQYLLENLGPMLRQDRGPKRTRSAWPTTRTSSPAASLTSWDCAARASTSTRPARHRWSPSTWPRSAAARRVRHRARRRGNAATVARQRPPLSARRNRVARRPLPRLRRGRRRHGGRQRGGGGGSEAAGTGPG